MNSTHPIALPIICVELDSKDRVSFPTFDENDVLLTGLLIRFSTIDECLGALKLNLNLPESSLSHESWCKSPEGNLIQL